MRNRQIILPVILFISCLFMVTSDIIAQNGRLFGLVDNSLVEIDRESGSTAFIATTNIPPGVEVSNLAFAPNSCLYYGIINPTTNPSLVSIGWAGNYYEVGELSLPVDTIFACKALAYNSVDSTLYAAVSLNNNIGGIENTCESIVGVNSTNGEAFFKTQLSLGSTTEADIDDMVFIGDKIYFHDAAPNNSNTSNYYSANLNNAGTIMGGNLLLSNSYIGDTDMAAIDNNILISTIDRAFYRLNTTNNSLIYIGQTHNSSEFNGALLTGLEYGIINEYYQLSIDSTICEGESITTNINVPGAIITWNNGQTGNTLTVGDEGQYWADIFLFNCLFTTDTMNIVVEDCGPCTVLFNQLTNDLTLPNDTTICDFHQLAVSVDLGLPIDVAWNTGETGNTIFVEQPGTYEAIVYYQNCEWPTTSITVDMEPCDTCIFVALAVEEQLFIGNDTTICLDDELVLNLDLDSTYIVTWSNGDTGVSTTISEAGTYLASISTAGCVFDSDSIRIMNSACERPCEYFIPNAFSPQGDNINDIFQIYFGENICELIAIEISIFDRWGGFLFKTNKNEWDGNINNKAIGVGTYVYMVRMVVEQDGLLKDIIDSGDITVFR